MSLKRFGVLEVMFDVRVDVLLLSRSCLVLGLKSGRVSIEKVRIDINISDCTAIANVFPAE